MKNLGRGNCFAALVCFYRFLFYFVPLFDGHKNRCQCTTFCRMTLRSLHRRHLPSLQCSIRTRAHWDGERQGEICTAPYGGPRHFGAFDPVVGISKMLSNGLAFRIQQAQNLVSPSGIHQHRHAGAARGRPEATDHVTPLNLLGDTDRETNGKKTGQRPTHALACRRHQAPATCAHHQPLPVRLLRAQIRSASAQECAKMQSYQNSLCVTEHVGKHQDIMTPRYWIHGIIESR